MDNGVELDDIQIVEVTGKAHRDKQHKSHKGGCHCSPSLRATTIIIFVCIGVVYVIGVAIGNVLMFNSLEYLDQGSSNTSINRLAMLIEDDMVKLQQMVRDYAFSPLAIAAVDAMVKYPTGPDDQALNETWGDPTNPSPLYSFMVQYVNNTPIGTTDEWDNRVMWFGTSSETNFWAFVAPNFTTLFSFYHPKDPNDNAYASIFRSYPPPEFYGSVLQDIVKESGKVVSGWLKMLIPNENVFEPMIISMEVIADLASANITAKDLNKYTDYKQLPEGFIHGYLISGRSVQPRMKLFSDDVPTCITMKNGVTDTATEWDAVDLENFAKVEKGTFGVNKSYGGKPFFAKREFEILNKSKTRRCPAVPLFNSTSSLMTGYITLCGMDPKKYENASCVQMRLDRPMSMVDQGTLPVVYLSLEIIAMMIVLCVIFVVFLDCVVLRRIVNLSNVIKKQTHGHAQALKDEDETTATMSTHEDKYNEKHGKSGKQSKAKSGKSASGTSENSRTTNSSDAGGGAGAYHGTGRDEIGNLKRAMEQNALGLRKRLEAVNDSIKIEQQKTIRHKQAMQLLNLWCGRKDYFPGLRPNAMQLRYEPTRNLDDLLNNPLAIEYLKSHCESDRTLENLWFILDVSWLEELETAEDNEQDDEKRAQIHEVATCAAKTILQRYIAVNAPQQINISAGTYKKLREKGDHYARHMFEDAVSEVKLMMNTDILPRFQKSAAYSAMSETLFIDSSGDGDESEFSDETVSTAGSILTDEAEEGEGGVAHVFAHTFKNLHTAFDVAHDENSSTYSASSSHATSGVAPSSSVAAGTVTSGTGGQGEKGTSVSKDEIDTNDSEDDEPEPPKLEDKPKEDPKKKESEGSSDSSDSSGGSISSDSMSESSSAASTSTGPGSSESD